jgi:hypothetical protein
MYPLILHKNESPGPRKGDEVAEGRRDATRRERAKGRSKIDYFWSPVARQLRNMGEREI